MSKKTGQLVENFMEKPVRLGRFFLGSCLDKDRKNEAGELLTQPACVIPGEEWEKLKKNPVVQKLWETGKIGPPRGSILRSIDET